jgi:hypothetical protein
MIGTLFLKIRRKPKHVRDNIAFASAGVVTLAVFLVWLLNVPDELLSEAKQDVDTVKPFATLFNQIKEQTASIGDSLEEMVPDTASTTAVSDESVLQTTGGTPTTAISPQLNEAPREVQITTISKASSTATTTENID